MITVQFPFGVPNECIEWLWDNIGSGNIVKSPYEPNLVVGKEDSDAWICERIYLINKNHILGQWIPVITVIDDQAGLLFKLKWS